MNFVDSSEKYFHRTQITTLCRTIDVVGFAYQMGVVLILTSITADTSGTFPRCIPRLFPRNREAYRLLFRHNDRNYSRFIDHRGVEYRCFPRPDLNCP